jgi:hypothetical protein
MGVLLVANYSVVPLSRDDSGAAVPPHGDSGTAHAADASIDLTRTLVPDSRRHKSVRATGSPPSTTLLRRVSDEVTAAALPLDTFSLQGSPPLLPPCSAALPVRWWCLLGY